MPKLTLATSNLNFGYRDALTRSPQWIAGQVEAAGFDGIEWNDIPNVHPASLAHGGLARWLAKRGLIQSMQQSWQSDGYRDLPQYFRNANKEQGAIKGVAAAAKQGVLIAMLPRLPQSLDHLQRVQKAAGKRLPVIAHPNEQHLGDKPRHQTIDYQAIRESGKFGPLRFQVTAEYLAAIGVPLANADETVESLYATLGWRNEFDEIVYDSHHALMERDGHTLPQPATIAGLLARDGKLAELQMAWRPDFGGDPAELQAALSGYMAETRQGRILEQVRTNTPEDAHLYVVVETPASVLGADYWSHLGTLASGIRNALPEFEHSA